MVGRELFGSRGPGFNPAKGTANNKPYIASLHPGVNGYLRECRIIPWRKKKNNVGCVKRTGRPPHGDGYMDICNQMIRGKSC